MKGMRSINEILRRVARSTVNLRAFYVKNLFSYTYPCRTSLKTKRNLAF